MPPVSDDRERITHRDEVARLRSVLRAARFEMDHSYSVRQWWCARWPFDRQVQPLSSENAETIDDGEGGATASACVFSGPTPKCSALYGNCKSSNLVRGY